MQKRSKAVSAAVGVLLATAGASAQLDQSTIVAPGGFAQAGATTTGFANATGHGGFKESFVATTNGPQQTGFVLVDIAVSGSLAATGFAGLSTFGVSVYKDDQQIDTNPFWSRGNSDPQSADFQFARWSLSTSFVGDTGMRGVNDVVTFAVPVTFGETFTLGVYAEGHAGKRSSSAVPGGSTADLQFQNTLNWGALRNRR